MLLELNDISLDYDGSTIFQNITLTVDAGDLIIIGGPSGSGKSSLLRLLNRLNEPTSGRIVFNGRPLDDYKVIELRKQICYLQQTPLMIEGGVRDNLLLPFRFLSMKNMAPPSDESLVKLLGEFRLEGVGLEADAMTLSVGQKQRISFIRALLLKPEVLLLDEPTSALDIESRAIVEERIEALAADYKIAVIVITHLDFEPTRAAARKYVLGKDGLKGFSQ